MLDFHTLSELSRHHCVAICAFLVPANLLATSTTLIMLFLEQSIPQVRLVAIIASCFALTLFLHIGTWLLVGVIALPSFILSGLGVTCLLINFLTIINTQKFQELLKSWIKIGNLLARG